MFSESISYMYLIIIYKVDIINLENRKQNLYDIYQHCRNIVMYVYIRLPMIDGEQQVLIILK